MNKYINYRPEIDGLRAIAVISVIFYHSTLQIFEKKFLPGGFLGVDIFFVISGYLISKIIVNEILKTKNFSYLNFFKRRVKRIVPALFFVILVTFPIIYYKTMPFFFIEYAKSIISIIFFISNLFFWNTAIGYDQLQNIQFQPFLHAWTLSLEEQFYLIFPFIFIFIFKNFKKNYFLIILVGFLCSLLLADYMSYSHASLNFYSLPTRAWEFLAGTIIVLVEKKNFKFKKVLSNLLVLVGVFLIVISFIILSDKMYLPSIISILPVLGTSLIIYFSNKDFFAIKLLSSKLFRAIGLISYSLYLWHYPIFIIFPNMFLFLQLIIILVLSVFSYFFVERKFRSSSPSQFYSLKTIFLSGVIILSLAIITIPLKKNYDYSNFPTIIQKSLVEKGVIKVQKKIEFGQAEKSEQKNLFVVGDSHMFVLYEALKKTNIVQNYNLISQNLSGGCYYIFDFDKINYFSGKKDLVCNKINQEKRRDNFLKKNQSIVIIGGRLPVYLNGDNLKINRFFDKKTNELPQEYFLNDAGTSFETGVKKSINELLNKGTKVILIYPVPVLEFNPPKKIFDSYIFDRKNFENNIKNNPFTSSYSKFLEYAAASHELYDSFKHQNIYKVFTHKIFCSEKKNVCNTHDENSIFYRDDNHLSFEGNKKLINLIEKKMYLIKSGKRDEN